MANYKKRKDGRYVRIVTIGIQDGKRVRKAIYGKTLKELDKNYREFMAMKDNGIILEENRITFQQLTDLWLKNEKVGDVKDQTITNIRSQLKNINSYIGHVYVKDLRKSHIEEMRADELERGCIDQYNKALSLIRTIMEYAISINVAFVNPTHGMKRIRYSGKAKKRAMNQYERNCILTADLTDFEKTFTWLLLYTGIRKSEALALIKEDIDFGEMTITISKTLVSSKSKDEVLQNMPKTSAGNRTIPLPAPLYAVLKKYCAGKAPSDIVFESEYGGYMAVSSFSKRWKTLIRHLNNQCEFPMEDDFTPHLFRHTYASDLYKAGVDIKTAQYLLGHSDVKTTLDTYTHFEKEDVKLEKLSSYYAALGGQKK